MTDRLFRLAAPVLFALGLLVLWLLLRRVGGLNFLGILLNLHYPYLLISVLLFCANLFLVTLRFRVLLVYRCSFLELFRIYLQGFIINNVAPVQGGGAAYRAVMMKRANIPYSNSTSTLVFEPILDVAFCLLVTGTFLLLFWEELILGNTEFFESQQISLKLVTIIMAAVVTVAIMLATRTRFFQKFKASFVQIFASKRLVTAIFITMLCWLTVSASAYFLLLSAGVSVPFLYVSAAQCAAYGVGVFTFVPGGIGVREAVMAYVYSLTMNSINSISIPIISRLITTLTGVILLLILTVFFPKQSFRK